MEVKFKYTLLALTVMSLVACGGSDSSDTNDNGTDGGGGPGDNTELDYSIIFGSSNSFSRTEKVVFQIGEVDNPASLVPVDGIKSLLLNNNPISYVVDTKSNSVILSLTSFSTEEYEMLVVFDDEKKAQAKLILTEPEEMERESSNEVITKVIESTSTKEILDHIDTSTESGAKLADTLGNFTAKVEALDDQELSELANLLKGTFFDTLFNSDIESAKIAYSADWDENLCRATITTFNENSSSYEAALNLYDTSSELLKMNYSDEFKDIVEATATFVTIEAVLTRSNDYTAMKNDCAVAPKIDLKIHEKVEGRSIPDAPQGDFEILTEYNISATETNTISPVALQIFEDTYEDFSQDYKNRFKEIMFDTAVEGVNLTFKDQIQLDYDMLQFDNLPDSISYITEPANKEETLINFQMYTSEITDQDLVFDIVNRYTKTRTTFRYTVNSINVDCPEFIWFETQIIPSQDGTCLLKDTYYDEWREANVEDYRLVVDKFPKSAVSYYEGDQYSREFVGASFQTGIVISENEWFEPVYSPYVERKVALNKSHKYYALDKDIGIDDDGYPPLSYLSYSIEPYFINDGKVLVNYENRSESYSTSSYGTEYFWKHTYNEPIYYLIDPEEQWFDWSNGFDYATSVSTSETTLYKLDESLRFPIEYETTGYTENLILQDEEAWHSQKVTSVPVKTEKTFYSDAERTIVGTYSVEYGRPFINKDYNQYESSPLQATIEETDGFEVWHDNYTGGLTNIDYFDVDELSDASLASGYGLYGNVKNITFDSNVSKSYYSETKHLPVVSGSCTLRFDGLEDYQSHTVVRAYEHFSPINIDSGEGWFYTHCEDKYWYQFEENNDEFESYWVDEVITEEGFFDESRQTYAKGPYSSYYESGNKAGFDYKHLRTYAAAVWFEETGRYESIATGNEHSSQHWTHTTTDFYDPIVISNEDGWKWVHTPSKNDTEVYTLTGETYEREYFPPQQFNDNWYYGYTMTQKWNNPELDYYYIADFKLYFDENDEQVYSQIWRDTSYDRESGEIISQYCYDKDFNNVDCQ